MRFKFPHFIGVCPKTVLRHLVDKIIILATPARSKKDQLVSEDI
jgi:hypothetical protein